MVEFCLICKRRIDNMNWKTADINDGKIHWICGKHFTHSRIEFVPKSTKEDRAKYAKSLLQPFRKGEPSREFIEAYPEQAKGTFTEKELRKAKYVWTDQPNAKNFKKAL